MSDSEDSVRVSVTPSRPPLPPSLNRPLPPAGTTPHIPSNLPVITGGDAPDEFGDGGRNDEDDGADESDRVSDLLAAEKSSHYNSEHVGIRSTRSSSSGGDTDEVSESSLHAQHDLIKRDAQLRRQNNRLPT
jgi:hypothetical protein